MLQFVSYRVKKDGGDACEASSADLKAFNNSSLTLLIHGYNCDVEAATNSYTTFVQRLNGIATVSANFVGIFWAGDNWEGAVYYMQSLAKVKQTAIFLAKDLYNAAVLQGKGLKVDIVAHSMGNRLVLETLNVLNNSGYLSDQRLIINRVVFMAAAVPTSYLEPYQKLNKALATFKGTMSLYSRKDPVLHYGFPLGESLLGEGFFPVALGRKNWVDGSCMSPKLIQKSNDGAGHSDYWGADPQNLKHTKQENFAASNVRGFLDLGGTPPRSTPVRSTETADGNAARSTVKGRSTATFRSL